MGYLSAKCKSNKERIEKNMSNLIKKLSYLLEKKEKIKLIFILIMIIGGSIAELLGVAILLPIVNLAIDDNYQENMWCKIVIDYTGKNDRESILLILIGITVFIYIFKTIYLICMHNTLYKFSANVKSNMARKLMTAYLKQPYKFFLNKNSSELIRAVNQDTGQIYEIILNVLNIISNGLTALSLILTLFVTNVVMTLVVAAFLGISASIILFFIQKKTRYYGRRNQQLSSSILKYIQQSFEGIKEIKILGNEKFFIDQYIETYMDHAETGRKYNLSGMIPKYLIETVCIVGIMLYFGFNIAFNPNYLEIVPQLTVFVAASTKLIPSVNSLYTYFNTIMYHKAAIDVIYDDVKEADELNTVELLLDGSYEKMKFNEEVSLSNLTFKYDKTERKILDKISMVVPKGKSIALIGPSGEGKTTTADIILGLLIPTEGKVLVDGVDIQTNLPGWRRQIGYIPQSIYLIDDSIKNNIALGVPEKDIKIEKIMSALKEAQLLEFVQGLENGIETKIGERGTRISGGQRQRIGIARALYHNPEILVFDEATSALDTKTEKEVMNAIEGLQGTKTIIMIAHRLSTIEKCDIVYKVEKGSVSQER
ncbi:MAG: ABC transporter ATP-binding protein [Lachnospiraceae bacterium]|nr:ABC transporter ATP-binding protein [Lachnospiraceae bacterium]